MARASQLSLRNCATEVRWFRRWRSLRPTLPRLSRTKPNGLRAVPCRERPGNISAWGPVTVRSVCPRPQSLLTHPLSVAGCGCRRYFPGPERADHPDEPGRFVVAFVTVAVVIVASIGNAYVSEGLSHGVRALFAAAILVLFSVIGLSLVFDTSWSKRSAHSSAVGVPVLESPLLGNDGSTGFTIQQDAEMVVLSKQSRAGVSPAVYGELNMWQTMATLDCWLMVFCTFATMASNGVVSVNIAQICQAAGRPHATPFLLTLYGTGSAIGRERYCRIRTIEAMASIYICGCSVTLRLPHGGQGWDRPRLPRRCDVPDCPTRTHLR